MNCAAVYLTASNFVLENTGRLVGLCVALSSHRISIGKMLSFVASTLKIPRGLGFIRAISEYLETQRPQYC